MKIISTLLLLIFCVACNQEKPNSKNIDKFLEGIDCKDYKNDHEYSKINDLELRKAAITKCKTEQALDTSGVKKSEDRVW